jgi:DNA polymerase-1
VEAVKEIVTNRMRNAMPSLKVPMEIGMGTGDNWLEAH